MEYSKYQYVVTAAELRSFSKAAERCFVSQPALTRSVGKLEEELGVKLFDRSCSPIRLTYAGERYVERMKSILALQYQLDSEMAELAAQKRGRIAVGIPERRSATWLPQILPPFMAAHPETEIKVVGGSSGELEEAILNESIDVAVVAALPLAHPGIAYEVHAYEDLMIVLPDNHPAFRGRIPPSPPDALHHLKPEHLQKQPYVSVTPDQGLYHAASQLFDRHGIRPETAMQIADTSTAYYMASTGLGFTVMPVHAMDTEKYLRRPVFCTLDDPPCRRAIIAAYKEDRPPAAAVRQFLDVVKTLVAGSAQWHREIRVLYDIE